MNDANKYGSYLRGIFVFLIFGALLLVAIRALIWQNKPSVPVADITNNRNVSNKKIDPRAVLYKLKDFKKDNIIYFIQLIPGTKNRYDNTRRHLIYIVLENDLTIPIYIDDYEIIKDSLFKEPYVSNFSDSTSDLLDGRDGYPSFVKIHYYKDFLPVYKNN
jgi:hypothetical protein